MLAFDYYQLFFKSLFLLFVDKPVKLEKHVLEHSSKTENKDFPFKCKYLISIFIIIPF